jgi:hypothetical protein
VIQQNELMEPTPDESLVYLSDPIRDGIVAGTGRIVMCKGYLYDQIVGVSSILEINCYDREYPRNWIPYRSANNVHG